MGKAGGPDQKGAGTPGGQSAAKPHSPASATEPFSKQMPFSHQPRSSSYGVLEAVTGPCGARPRCALLHQEDIINDRVGWVLLWPSFPCGTGGTGWV